MSWGETTAEEAQALPSCRCLFQPCLCGGGRDGAPQEEDVLRGDLGGRSQAVAVKLFGCHDTSSIDAVLIALMTSINSDHPGWLQQRLVHAREDAGDDHKLRHLQSAGQLSEGGSSGLHGEPAPGESAGLRGVSFSHSLETPIQQLLLQQLGVDPFSRNVESPRDTASRIVIVGLEGHHSGKDAAMLRWARRHVLRPDDIVVLVSCWEVATDPKYLRVPGMILACTAAAAVYNREQQMLLQQHLRRVAAAALPKRHIYGIVVPVGRIRKNLVGNLLCRVSRELQADAIIVGAKRHWPLTRMIFGSVAAYARSHAQCPVVQCNC